MKDLAIIRIRHRGSAKVVKSALLYFHSRARSACVFALSIALWLIPRAGIASEAFEQKFDRVVVPRQWVQVVPPGERCRKPDLVCARERGRSYSRWTPMALRSMDA